jgi:hypothetical protein
MTDSLTAGSGGFLDPVLGGFGIDLSDDDLRAFAREAQRNRASYTSATAGHYRNFVF